VSRMLRRNVVTTVAGAIVVTGVLAYVIADRREEFATALQAAPIVVLLTAAALQLLALVVRTEAWHVCVVAAGGTVGRRRLFRAAGVGYLGSQLNSQVGTAARIGALRRTAPTESPRVPALIAAEVPILTIEGVLAALASFTLVGPLGLPWWLPIVLVAAAVLLVAGLRKLARRWREGFWSGLAVLRSLNGRSGVIGLILVAVFAQIARNWLMLHAVGVDASLFDATAVLIAMVTLSQLPIGPSVGAAAVVVILGAGGAALTAAAGVLLTATGTAGALAYAGWAGADRLWSLRPAARRAARLLGEDGDQLADAPVAGEGVGDRQVRADRVAVASADPLAGHVACVGELSDDAVRGPLGDPDRVADLAQTDAGVLRDADEHLSVVGEERPGTRVRHGRRRIVISRHRSPV
jgi:uncharacterized membrane protein YbhN (UPF0104 family)